MHIRIASASHGIKAELLKDDNKLFDGLLICNWVRTIFSKLLQISSEKLNGKLSLIYCDYLESQCDFQTLPIIIEKFLLVCSGI